MDKRQTGFFMLSMMFASIMSSAVSPYVITTLLKECGASTFLLSLIPVMCQAGIFFSLPVSLALAGYEPKNASIFMYAFSRMFLLVYIPVLAFPGLFAGKTVLIIFSAYVIMHLISASVSGVCASWLKQIILENKLGSLMGRRTALHSIIAGLLMPIIGFAIEKHGFIGVDKKTVFLWLMIVAVVAGFLDIKVLTKLAGAGNLLEKRSRAAFADVKKAAHNRCLWRAVGVAVFGNLGTLILTPFSILLFYELGLGEGMVALVIAVSTGSMAIGQILGGHYADRLSFGKIFLRSVFTGMLGTLALLGVSTGIFSFGLEIRIAGWIVICLTVLTSTASGAFMSVNTKYMFGAVKENFAVSFAFMDMARGLMIFCVSMGMAKIGAMLSAQSGFLAIHSWPGCHYIQLVLILSLGASILSMLYLKRQLRKNPI